MKLFFTTLFVLLTFLAATQALEEIEPRQVIAGNTNNKWATTRPYVILISIDGFRHDYATKYRAKNILKLVKKGASTSKMLSVFPSKTFPNHYSIATGLYPGNSGIISNEFYSRSRGGWYKMKDRSTVEDGTWYSGVPIWSLAEQQGMLSASFFWVGSAAQIAGFKPNYTYPYDKSIPNHLRIHQIEKWLNLPDSLRPHLINAYFSVVDDAGHLYGPDHPEVGKAVKEVDKLIGELRSIADQSVLDVNIVVVSDHGMTSINRGILLSEIVDLGDSEVYYSTPTFIYNSDSMELERMYNELKAHPLLTVYKRTGIPSDFNYQCEDRIGDLVVLTSPPAIILEKPKRVTGGTHGFDPDLDEMGAFFVAYGPAIHQRQKVEPFRNIHIYPFIAEILGLEIPPIDGDIEVLRPVLK